MQGMCNLERYAITIPILRPGSDQLTKEAAAAPSLEALKARLDRAPSNPVQRKVAPRIPGCWNQMIPRSPKTLTTL